MSQVRPGGARHVALARRAWLAGKRCRWSRQPRLSARQGDLENCWVANDIQRRAATDASGVADDADKGEAK